MIKIFRQIRYQLIGENPPSSPDESVGLTRRSGNTSKYLKYAIGEILLVMIGILLALQVNNWNENKKDRALEAEYYHRIYEDIQQDKEQIDQLIDQIKQRQSDANQLLRLVLKEEYQSRELLLQYVKTIRGSAVNFKQNDATYDDLKSSGNLGLIQDIQIKKSLNNYFKKVEPFISTNQKYIDHITDQYFKLSEYSKQIGMMRIQSETDEVGVTGFRFEKDIVEMLKQYEIGKIPVEYRETFFNLAYNMAANMERRKQLFEAIKREVLIIDDALEKKCTELDKN